MLYMELERRKRNLTQKQLSGAVKISAADLSRIEKGVLKPYPAWKIRLSEYFQMPPEQLLKEV